MKPKSMLVSSSVFFVKKSDCHPGAFERRLASAPLGQDDLKGAFQAQQRLQSPTLHRQSGRPRSPPRQAPSPGSSSTFLPHARSPITFASAKHLLRSACRQRTFIVGNDPWGGISFRLGCGGGNTKTWSNEALKNCFVMFPPPHPSLKEMPPQGVISYDEDGLD